jgi:hypothetical protein
LRKEEKNEGRKNSNEYESGLRQNQHNLDIALIKTEFVKGNSTSV